MKNLNLNIESASLKTLTEALITLANQISILEETPKSEDELAIALQKTSKFYNDLKIGVQNRTVLRYTESIKKSKK